MILHDFGAGLRHRECEPKGEVRGGPQEGDQEVAALLGPDQDLDLVQRDQGQEGDPSVNRSRTMICLVLFSVMIWSL